MKWPTFVASMSGELNELGAISQTVQFILEVRAPKEAVMAQNWEVESVDTAVMVIIKQIR